MKANTIAAGWLLSLTACLTPISAGESAIEALKEGELELDLRYRYEFVDEDGFDENAQASTIRLRLGYGTGTFYGVRLFASLQGVQSVGSERYNSTQNGNTQYPLVADPTDVDFNEGFVAYSGIDQTDFILGRQRVNLGEQRFFGSVAWRQLEQTFNGFVAKSDKLERWSLFYGHFTEVHKVQGRNNPNPLLATRDLRTDVLEAKVELDPVSLKGYVHLNEYEDPSASAVTGVWSPTSDFSFKNFGLRIAGAAKASKKVKLNYAAEYTNQSQYADALDIVDADYYLAELTAKLPSIAIRGQVEVLGGDGAYGFQTPFATLWKFNGWTDRFLVTPTTGLRDHNLTVSGTVEGIALLGRYHYYTADAQGGSYGEELELGAVRNFKNDMFTAGLRLAFYKASGEPDSSSSVQPFQLDTTKVWLWGTFRL